MSAVTKRTEKLDLRISQSDKELLRAAAAASRKSLSDFVLDCAILKAEALMGERQRIVLGADDWAAFQEALDREPAHIPALAKLMKEPGLLDK